MKVKDTQIDILYSLIMTVLNDTACKLGGKYKFIFNKYTDLGGPRVVSCTVRHNERFKGYLTIKFDGEIEYSPKDISKIGNEFCQSIKNFINNDFKWEWEYKMVNEVLASNES